MDDEEEEEEEEERLARSWDHSCESSTYSTVQ